MVKESEKPCKHKRMVEDTDSENKRTLSILWSKRKYDMVEEVLYDSDKTDTEMDEPQKSEKEV